MPRINYLISNHKLPAIAQYQWRCYMPKKFELDAWRVGELEQAMKWIEANVVGNEATQQTCNEGFSMLPGERTFSDVWSDPGIWISFHTSDDPKFYGQTTGKQNISVSYGSFRRGWKAVAATLIHELAHINGAGSKDTKAEDTLKVCGLGEYHDTTIIGYLRSMPKNAVLFS